MCFGPELLLLGKSECPILSLIGKIQVGSLELCSVVKFIFCFSMIVPQCTKHGWMSLVRKNLTRPPTQSTLNKKRDCKQPTSASDGTSGLLFKWAKKKKIHVLKWKSVANNLEWGVITATVTCGWPSTSVHII